MRWLAVLLLLAGTATADDGGRRMLTEDEAVPFRAVGRVNIAGDRFCTGTLIAPDQVLTAAHCLYNPQTGARVQPNEIRFVAGLRIEKKAAMRRVVRVFADPDFTFGRAGPDGVGADLALLILAVPIPAKAAVPIDVGAGRAPFTIVSYGRDRPQAPSIETGCRVISSYGEGMALDCPVTEGVSGAPILAGSGDDRRIVGVVSAIGRTLGGAGQGVALAARVLPMLDRLRAEAAGAP